MIYPMVTKGTLLGNILLWIEPDDVVGTGRHAKLTSGAFFFVPDEFIPTDSPRRIQPLLRILRRYRMTEQVPYGYRQALGNADAVPFKFQLCPILT